MSAAAGLPHFHRARGKKKGFPARNGKDGGPGAGVGLDTGCQKKYNENRSSGENRRAAKAK
jgi:hypothetical protein